MHPQAIALVASDAASITLKVNMSTDNRGLPITEYRLFKDEGAFDSEFIEFATLDAKNPGYTGIITVTGLTPGLIYRFYSTAINAIG